MKHTPLCVMLILVIGVGPAQGKGSLIVSPNTRQFFKYDPVSLSCVNSTGWTVRRRNIRGAVGECGGHWGTLTGSSCEIRRMFPWDVGLYWCESEEGERSDAINITVTCDYVILESPVFPVTEGDAVTLRCWYYKTPTGFPADFYKDGSLIRNESTGQMTIHAVSKSDEGNYKCSISDRGESPESWVAVTGSPGAAPPWSVSISRVVCHLVVLSPYCLSTILLVSIYHHRPRGNVPPVSVPMAQLGGDQGLDEEYDDIADVTTEHHF